MYFSENTCTCVQTLPILLIHTLHKHAWMWHTGKYTTYTCVFVQMVTLDKYKVKGTRRDVRLPRLYTGHNVLQSHTHTPLQMPQRSDLSVPWRELHKLTWWSESFWRALVRLRLAGRALASASLWRPAWWLRSYNCRWSANCTEQQNYPQNSSIPHLPFTHREIWIEEIWMVNDFPIPTRKGLNILPTFLWGHMMHASESNTEHAFVQFTA